VGAGGQDTPATTDPSQRLRGPRNQLATPGTPAKGRRCALLVRIVSLMVLKLLAKRRFFSLWSTSPNRKLNDCGRRSCVANAKIGSAGGTPGGSCCPRASPPGRADAHQIFESRHIFDGFR